MIVYVYIRLLSKALELLLNQAVTIIYPEIYQMCAGLLMSGHSPLW